MDNKRIIGEIDDGIVIDHIPQGIVWKVARILRVDSLKAKVSLGDGYDSSKLQGPKGILKIQRLELTQYELDVIALVAPDATINIIKNGKVSKKGNAVIPKR